MAQQETTRGNVRIDIMGVVGVGKSTLGELLADKLGLGVIKERPDKNPYLKDFYKDPSAMALRSQVWFLTDKAELLRGVEEENQPDARIVVDPSVYMDWVFASNAHQLDLMDKHEWEMYEQLFKILIDGVPPPDLVVAILAEPEVCVQRVKGRGRDFEADISLEYLEGLGQTLNDWLEANRGHLSILEIETNGLNLVDCPADQNSVLGMVIERLSLV